MDANVARKVNSLLVADRETTILLDVERVYWATGGTKRGVMAGHPAWAFASKAAALAFIKQYGGSLTRQPRSLRQRRRK